MRILLRIVILASVVWVANSFVSTFFSMTALLIIPFPFLGMISIANMAVALGCGWLAWNKLNATEESTFSNAVLGGIILGATGISFGYYLPLLINPGNEQAVLGVFFIGPPAFVLGTILGLVVGKRRSKAWNGLLWTCAIASVVIGVSTQSYLDLHQSKKSSHIHESIDLEKRDSTLKYLHVRPLSDGDLIKLKRFKNLYGLNFEPGWASYEAKITDFGLKTLRDIKLPKLGALTLSHCSKITDEGLVYVAGIQTLKFVGLAACPQITDAGLRYLGRSRSIDTIDLRGCVGITDEGLRYLEIMPKLKRLRLGGCANITMRGIEQLRNSLPNVSIEKYDEQWDKEVGDLIHNDTNGNVIPRQSLDKDNSNTSNAASSMGRDSNISPTTKEVIKPLDSGRKFEGVWVNSNPNSLGIPKLEIMKVGEQWRIQAWGKCHSKYCELGKVELYFLEPSAASRDYTHAFAEWDYGFNTGYMLIQIDGDQLQIQTISIWRDARSAQDRSDYTKLYLFQRQANQ